MTVTVNNQPPHKCPATIIDYDLDKLQDNMTHTGSLTVSATHTTVSNATNQPMASSSPAMSVTTVNYAMDLLSLKTEIASLHNTITSIVEQIKNATVSLHTNSTSPSNAMTTDTDHPWKCTPSTNTPLTCTTSLMTSNMKLPQL